MLEDLGDLPVEKCMVTGPYRVREVQGNRRPWAVI